MSESNLALLSWSPYAPARFIRQTTAVQMKTTVQPRALIATERSEYLTCAPALAIASFPGRGRGVVALRAFAQGELVERAPVIALSLEDRARITASELAHYYFEWGEDDEAAAIVLGYGSLYNHSFSPNLGYEFREAELAVEFVALRDIAAGEELAINYNNLGDFADDPRSFDELASGTR